MEGQFSTTWKSSVRVSKQRKLRYNAPTHVRHNLLSAHLSKDLRKKHQRRSFPLRKGDEVKIMVGKFKGKIGKVTALDYPRLRVNIEGIQLSKKDGTKVNVPLNPSNLMITSLNLDDKKRAKSLSKENSKPKENKEAKN